MSSILPLRIVPENFHDTATLTATSEALPIDYTQRSGRSYVWRSVDLLEQVINGTLADAGYLNSVVVYAHNLSVTATVQVEYLASGVVVYDSGSVTASSIIPLGTWRAGIDPWGTTNTAVLPIRQFVFWTPLTAADSYRITINDSSNPDGFMQVGRFVVGEYKTPASGPENGMGFEWQDFAENRRTEAGSLRTVGEGVARRLSFDLAELNKTGLTSLSNMLLSITKKQDVYINVYPEQGGIIEEEHAFIARRESNYSHTNKRFGAWDSSLEFQEV